MKKLKYMFWLTLIVFFGLVVYQNLAFFSSKHTLHLNLGVYERSTPELTNGAIIAIFVGISVLIMMMLYFASRYDSYRSRKIIKELRDGMEDSANTISKLNHEVEMLKSSGSVAPTTEMPENESVAPDEKVNAPEA